MSTVYMLAGIPGSGKSHYAKECCKRHRAVLVATDSIRERLFGSEARQKTRTWCFSRPMRRSNRRWRREEMSCSTRPMSAGTGGCNFCRNSRMSP